MNYAETTLQVIPVENTDVISCSNCNRGLMRISKQTGQQVLFHVVVECPFCKDKSFSYEVKGPMKYLPAEGVQLKNCESLPNNVMKFKTCKRK